MSGYALPFPLTRRVTLTRLQPLPDGGRGMPDGNEADESNRGKQRTSEESALRPQFIPKCSSEKARNKKRQSAEEIEKSVGRTT